MATKLSRITVNFSDSAMQWINREAAKRSLSASEFLRRMVDEMRGEFVVPPAKRERA